MDREEIEKIFEESESKWKGDNAFQGLQIISKYFDPKKKEILCAAEHDVIYSVDIDDILKAGITKEDAETLAKLNWMIEDEFDCLACFV